MTNKKPTKIEAEEAVRTLIKWAGDNPDREGLKNTPIRVVEAYNEFFKGYKDNLANLSDATFGEVEKFNDIVLLQKIKFISFCEHHILPIIGYADVAYIPNNEVIGIGKIVRIVDVFSRRLQIQERLTVQIAEKLNSCLKPKGVAVSINAEHYCMNIRNMNQKSARMYTSHMIGVFKDNLQLKNQFIELTSKHNK